MRNSVTMPVRFQVTPISPNMPASVSPCSNCIKNLAVSLFPLTAIMSPLYGSKSSGGGLSIFPGRVTSPGLRGKHASLPNPCRLCDLSLW